MDLTKSVAVLIAAFLPPMTGYAQEAVDQETIETIILSSITESSLANISLIQDNSGESVDLYNLDMNIQDNSFSVSTIAQMGDDFINYSGQGEVTEDNLGNAIFQYSGEGSFPTDDGFEFIEFEGRANWLLNAETMDYDLLEFSHSMKIGQNTWWGWVVGAEVVVAGALTAGAVITTAPTTLGGSLLIGVTSIVQNGAAAVTISEVVRSSRDSDAQIEAPRAPQRPIAPPPETAFALNDLPENTLVVAVQGVEDQFVDVLGLYSDIELTGIYDTEEENFLLFIE